MLCNAEIVQLLRDEKSACDLCTFILAEFDDGVRSRYMGIVAVFHLAENLFAGQLNDHIDLFLIILCLSEVAELRRTALVEGYDMLIYRRFHHRPKLPFIRKNVVYHQNGVAYGGVGNIYLRFALQSAFAAHIHRLRQINQIGHFKSLDIAVYCRGRGIFQFLCHRGHAESFC